MTRQLGLQLLSSDSNSAPSTGLEGLRDKVPSPTQTSGTLTSRAAQRGPVLHPIPAPSSGLSVLASVGSPEAGPRQGFGSRQFEGSTVGMYPQEHE